jgi:hypothetical protein
MTHARAPLVILVLIPVLIAITAVSSSSQDSKTPTPKPAQPPSGQESKVGREYSGMYTFLKDGEFVQISVEDQGRVTGFVSRYGEGPSDKGTFLDQFFRSGKLDGNTLIFATETLHGMWFEFKGTVERGEGKNPGDEAYYVLKGTLTDNTSDAEKRVTTHTQEVVMKQFPGEAPPGRK